MLLVRTENLRLKEFRDGEGLIVILLGNYISVSKIEEHEVGIVTNAGI